MVWVIAANELRRRVRDRSLMITCFLAPLLLAAILGFAFGGHAGSSDVTIGVSGAQPALLRAAEEAAQLPATVRVHVVRSASALRHDVARGTYDGGVVVYRSAAHATLGDLLIPIAAPGATRTPGFDIGGTNASLVGSQWAEALAAGLSSRLYASRIGSAAVGADPPIAVTADVIGNAGKGVLNYFAPSIAVIFLFIGGGLGLRSLLLERAAGTLVRMAAAPVQPWRIVAGKLLAIFLTGLLSILVVWTVTSVLFGADWGSVPGVLLMCIGATLAMCGLGVLITSLAKDEQAAFGMAMLVGLVLALLGGNLLPAGALPSVFTTLSLLTPNGWALVGFGRLALLHDSTSGVVGPFVVLVSIAVATTSVALTRVRAMVRP